MAVLSLPRGGRGGGGWYTGPVTFHLEATDNRFGSGAVRSPMSPDGGRTWVDAADLGLVPGAAYGSSGTRKGVASLADDGEYLVLYRSIDGDGNLEETRSFGAIRIDGTGPTVAATADPSRPWPPDGRMVTVRVSGRMADALSGIAPHGATFSVSDSEGPLRFGGVVDVSADGTFSFTIQLPASRTGQDPVGRRFTITIDGRDRAGNPGTGSAVVIVPHDLRGAGAHGSAAGTDAAGIPATVMALLAPEGAVPEGPQALLGSKASRPRSVLPPL